MAQRGSNDVGFVLANGYTLLGATTNLDSKVEAQQDDGTVLGNTWAAPEAVGTKLYTLSQEGFFDDAAGSTNQAFADQEGIAGVFCYGPNGNVIGRTFEGVAGTLEADYEVILAVGKLSRAKASYQGAGYVKRRAVILHALGAETAAGDTKANRVDNAAASANGGSGFLQVTGLTLGGFTNAVIKIVHSVDAVTWVDLVTFSAVTAAPSAQRVAVAGTIDRYLAVTWAFTGTGSGESMSFLAGFGRD